MWSISLLSYTFKHQNMHYIKIAYLISSLFVILSSKLYWLAKVSHLQKFKIISITPKFRYDILSCTAPKYGEIDSSSIILVITSNTGINTNHIKCSPHNFYDVPHSLLYALLHRTGHLWLQQDLLYHLLSHQDKQSPVRVSKITRAFIMSTNSFM